MSVALRRFRVYVRAILVLLVVAAVGLVLFNNRGHAVPVWFFWLTDATKPVNVVWLMLCTAVGTLVTWWTIRIGWHLWRDTRELKRVQALQQTAKGLDKRSAELDERERRIDEKLRREIAKEE